LTIKDLFATVWLKLGDIFQLKKRDEVKLLPGFPIVLVRSKQLRKAGLANMFVPESSPMLNFPQNSENGLTFASGVFSKGKLRDENEDAYFHTGKSLGIADGVSAWRKYRIDAGQFAREMMGHCREICLTSDSSSQEVVKGLSGAHNKMQAYGSCTVSLGFLVGPHLSLSILGDSSAIVVRWVSGRPAIVFRTGVLVHSFNTPYQLAKVPKYLDCASFIHDKSVDALHFSIDIAPGDLLIMGSDGLWDNLYDDDLISLLEGEDVLSPQGVADMLGNQAYLNSKSKASGPFQEAVQQAYPGALWRGGKTDDVTVLAALVVDLN
jgi:protein phosphatase PTC7